MIISLFGDAPGLAIAKDMDETMSALPGLAGLTIFQDARKDAFRRLQAARAATGNVSVIPERRRDRPSAMPFAAMRQ